MDNTYPGDAWSRLRDWLKIELDTLQAQILSGSLTASDYASFCGRASDISRVLNQMKLIQSGEDILGKHIPSPLRDVE